MSCEGNKSLLLLLGEEGARAFEVDNEEVAGVGLLDILRSLKMAVEAVLTGEDERLPEEL